VLPLDRFQTSLFYLWSFQSFYCLRRIQANCESFVYFTNITYCRFPSEYISWMLLKSILNIWNGNRIQSIITTDTIPVVFNITTLRTSENIGCGIWGYFCLSSNGTFMWCPPVIPPNNVKQGKAVPLHAMKAPGGERKYSSYSFSTSPLDGGE
jgi:hypothetical protein